MFYAAVVSRSQGKKIFVAWLFLAFAQISYFMGDVLWGLSEAGLFVFSTLPADFFYILNYILFLVAVLFLSSQIMTLLNQMKLFIDILIVLSSAILISLIFFILPFFQSNDLQMNLLWLSYVFLDFFLFITLISLFFQFKKYQTPLFLLAAGIFFFIVTDLIFAFSNLERGYVSGGLVDIGWVTGYMFIGLAAISQIAKDDIDFKKYLPQFSFNDTFKWNIYVPLILVLIAYICNVWAYKNLISDYLYLLDYIVGIIVFMVIIRQIITLKENRSLYFEARDEIKKREIMESALQKSEKKYRKIVENANEGIVSTDPEGLLMFYNHRFSSMLGYEKDELQGRDIFSLMNDESQKKAKACMINIKKGEKGQNELTMIKKDGKELNVLTNVSAILDDQQYSGCLALISDITETKKAQMQIEDSLVEKEILLREIHHRVKNNMQIISSMLSLQSNYIEDEEMLQIFAESRNRVKSMALVHEKLYTSDDIAKIDIKDYMQDIIKYMASSYVRDEISIDFKVIGEDISLNIDTAVPLCLIINELLTNSIKYAFPHSKRGNEIIVEISSTDDGYELLIIDNGIGLGDDFDLNRVDSLGLNIVNVLVKQLKGSIDILKTSGTAFKILFKDNQK